MWGRRRDKLPAQNGNEKKRRKINAEMVAVHVMKNFSLRIRLHGGYLWMCLLPFHSWCQHWRWWILRIMYCYSVYLLMDPQPSDETDEKISLVCFIIIIDNTGAVHRCCRPDVVPKRISFIRLMECRRCFRRSVLTVDDPRGYTRHEPWGGGIISHCDSFNDFEKKTTEYAKSQAYVKAVLHSQCGISRRQIISTFHVLASRNKHFFSLFAKG